MKEIIQISEALLNLAKKKIGIADPKVEAIALRRYKICYSCDVRNKTTDRCRKRKGGCGCPCTTKVRSMTTSCPLNKWKEVKKLK